MAREFNFADSCCYDMDKKNAFHSAAKRQLKKFASLHMGFSPSSYDLRSNMGGIAVSGEITLHHNDLYIQAAQSVMGSDKGLLIRTCKDRKDYSGGQNHFAPLDWLNDENLPKLEKLSRQILEQKHGHDADALNDPGYNQFTSVPRFSK